MSHNQNKQTLTDQELVQKWCDQPAPLLPILHAFHDRDGFVSESAMRTISLALKIPLAELFGTVSFYIITCPNFLQANQPHESVMAQFAVYEAADNYLLNYPIKMPLKCRMLDVVMTSSQY